MFFPPEGEAELSALLDHLKADILTGVARVYCEHFSGVERAAAARDADKERKLRGAQDELRSVLDHWENAEEDRDLALAEIDDLQVILLERDHQIARLEGRIEQLTLELRTRFAGAGIRSGSGRRSPLEKLPTNKRWPWPAPGQAGWQLEHAKPAKWPPSARRSRPCATGSGGR